MSKIKIMFVCMGNICRSPLAHAVFQELVNKEELDQHFFIESSGTIGYHVGELPDHRMRKVAASHGYTMDHRARKFIASNLEDFDMVLAMDRDNLDHIERSKKNSSNAETALMRFYDSEATGPADVPDPYYGGAEGFEEVFRIVYRSSRSLLDQLIEKYNLK